MEAGQKTKKLTLLNCKGMQQLQPLLLPLGTIPQISLLLKSAIFIFTLVLTPRMITATYTEGPRAFFPSSLITKELNNFDKRLLIHQY